MKIEFSTGDLVLATVVALAVIVAVFFVPVL